VNDYVVPAVIAHEGIVYVTGGRKPQTLAIRAGGRGDVTDTHLVWEINRATKVPTPVYHDGCLYWVGNKGMALCVKADDGEVIYRERLRDLEGKPDKVYASPIAIGDKLFCVTRQSGTLVLAARPEFELLAQNDLGDPSIFNATAVPAGDRLLIRSDRYLYCIGK
jgi:outer membrane protein assembly factor BamB